MSQHTDPSQACLLCGGTDDLIDLTFAACDAVDWVDEEAGRGRAADEENPLGYTKTGHVCESCYGGPCISCGGALEEAPFDRGERIVEPRAGCCGVCVDEAEAEIAGEAAAELRMERWA